MIRIEKMGIAVAVLGLAACQTAPAEPTAACSVPRIMARYAATPPALRPADQPPKPSVLPTPEMSEAEAVAAGDCVRPKLLALAAASGDSRLVGSAAWPRFSRSFYRSEHGRYLEVAGNALARDYLKFEDGAPLPVGALVTKRSFNAKQSGEVTPGPQFVIERMAKGYDPRVGDWKFTLISDTGAIVGESRGRDGDKVEYCVECHKSAWRQDFLFFVPPDSRPTN